MTKANAIIETMSTKNQVILPKIAQERMNRLETRTAKIGVIGLGYVGLPLSLLLSEAGFKVTGFDIDTKKVVDLEAGDRISSGFRRKRSRARGSMDFRLRRTSPVCRIRTPSFCAYPLR